MGSRDATPQPEDAAERARFLRRAAEARAFVARVDPSLLDTSGVDATLHDLTLSRSVLERLQDAYRHELGNQWLRGLRRADPSGRR
jgi:hypothetical protein